ncbi:MAG: hypothetical protein ACRDOP_09730 [Gaiellaceae bacterium]
MLRGSILAALVVGALLFAAGCGGEESAVCGDLEDVQSSIEDVRGIELNEGAVDELQQAAADIRAGVQAAQADADAELGDELEAFQTDVQALVDEAEALGATELSAESLQALSGAISDATASFQAVQDAAPDCDL